MEFTPRRRLELVSGRSHPELARDVAAQLGVTLGEANLREFANGEIHCRFDTSIRGSDVFIIQTHCGPVNDSLMEHLIMIDAAKRASAKRITAVCPYYGYSRQDRKASGRERSRPNWWPTCCRWPAPTGWSASTSTPVRSRGSSTCPSTI
jgi:ribose-phosphate pyrophosphokinase